MEGMHGWGYPQGVNKHRGAMSQRLTCTRLLPPERLLPVFDKVIVKAEFLEATAITVGKRKQESGRDKDSGREGERAETGGEAVDVV